MHILLKELVNFSPPDIEVKSSYRRDSSDDKPAIMISPGCCDSQDVNSSWVVISFVEIEKRLQSESPTNPSRTVSSVLAIKTQASDGASTKISSEQEADQSRSWRVTVSGLKLIENLPILANFFLLPFFFLLSTLGLEGGNEGVSLTVSHPSTGGDAVDLSLSGMVITYFKSKTGFFGWLSRTQIPAQYTIVLKS